MSVPERKETQGTRWADCEDDEGKEEEEREQETRQETGQEEVTSEKPPGLEQREESKQEARENEERRAQEAREQRKAQEKQKREAKAQEERENGVKAQEQQKKEVSAQGEQESHTREGKAQGERREEREVEAQEGHDGEEEMATQEKCVEAKKEVNSMHEENDVSNRHMTWWRRLVGPYGQRPTLTDGARPSKSVARSHESRAENARDRKGRRERKGEVGARDNGEKRKQHPTRCLPLSNHYSKYNTHNNSSSGSSKRRNAFAVARRPQVSSS